MLLIPQTHGLLGWIIVAFLMTAATALAAPPPPKDFTFLIGPYPSKGLFEYQLDAGDFIKTHPDASRLLLKVERNWSAVKNDSHAIGKDGKPHDFINDSQSIGKDGKAHGFIDVEQMPDGAEYTVTGMIVDAAGNKELGRESDTFKRTVMPFEKEPPTGTSDIIVPPFTAPVVDHDTVSCILRTYQHGTDGLLTQVTAAGEPLFARPVVFRARTGSGELTTLKGGPPTLSAVGKTAMAFKQTFSGEGIDLNVEGSFDYDGFYLFTVHLLPTNGPVQLQDLRLELPYRDTVAKLIEASVTWRRNDGTQKQCSGDLDPKQGILWDSKTFPSRNWKRIGNMPPFVWLGDDDRGLVYSCASEEGMHDDEHLPAAQVERVGTQVVYTAWFVNNPLQLHGERTFQFALQASPFKPMAEHANLWRNAGYREPYKNGVSFTNWFTDGSYPTYGRFLTLDLLKKYANATGVDQVGTMASAVSECGGTPEYLQFWHEWGSDLVWNKVKRNPPEEWAVKMLEEAKLPMNPYVRVESASNVSATNVNYRTWWYNEEARHSDISFIYQDNPPYVYYDDPPNGYGYQRDNGQREPTSAIWNSRQFAKRIATTAVEAGKTNSPFIWANAISPVLPGRSFCRKMLNGEYLYTKLLTLGQIRVMASHQWGMELDWYPFPQTDESPYPNIGPVRKYWRECFSRLLLHDITNISGGDDSDNTNRWINALDLFWLDDPSVVWHPYYRADAIKANHSTTLISAYTASDRATLFVSNQDNKSVVESVPLSELARVENGNLKYFYDAETGEEIETSDALKLFIADQDYRVVIGMTKPWPFAPKNVLGMADLPAQSTLNPEDTLTAISKQLLTSKELQPVHNGNLLYEEWMKSVMNELAADSNDVTYFDAKACSDIAFGHLGIQCSLFYDKRHNCFLANFFNDSSEDVRLADSVRHELGKKVGQPGHEYISHPVTGISEWSFIDIPSHRGLLELWYPEGTQFWGARSGPLKTSNMMANIVHAISSRQKEMGGRVQK